MKEKKRNGMEERKNEAIVTFKTRCAGHEEGEKDSTKMVEVSSGHAEIPSSAGSPSYWDYDAISMVDSVTTPGGQREPCRKAKL